MSPAEAHRLGTNSITSGPLQAEARRDPGIPRSRALDGPPRDPCLCTRELTTVRPQVESNHHLSFRRALLYPLEL